jgi:hypothetical protein
VCTRVGWRERVTQRRVLSPSQCSLATNAGFAAGAVAVPGPTDITSAVKNPSAEI